MSLLLSEGHQNADSYPIAVVWSEANIVRQRHARRIRTAAAVQVQVIASVLSKKGGKALKKTLDEMNEHD